MTEEKKSLDDLSLIGGALCLDFINTLDWRGREERHDYLADYQGLLGWWSLMGLITPQEADELADRAALDPGAAEDAAARAVRLRESLYRVFTSFQEPEQVPGEDLDRLNQGLAQAFSGVALWRSGEGLIRDFTDRDQSLDWPLKPVLRSALEVLTQVPPERIKTCRNQECGWLFWDKSKNRSRCWCDMADCGNRAKAGRFYRRNKASAG